MKKVFLLLCLIFIGTTYSASASSAISDSANKIQTYHFDTLKISAFKQYLYRASVQKVNDLKHTKLAVKFDWQKCRMPAQATITLAPHFYAVDSVTLDAKGFDINRVGLILSKKDTTNLSFFYDSLQLKIKLPRVYLRNEQYTLFIDYVAKPNERKTKSGNAITSDKGLYFINPSGADNSKPRQVWTQGETQSASCWFPTIDAPNQKCTEEIFITHEKEMTTLSNGKKLYSITNEDSTETDVWRLDKPHSPYLFMMAVGTFAKSENYLNDSLEVSYYVDPLYQEYADEIFGKTPQMIDFFGKRLNYKFPWDKYSQVVAHDYVSGAMENTSATLHGEFMQRNSRELLDKNYEEVIAHELFHQWFGDLVTCESWSNVTLNESFATYGEYLWEEFAYGKDVADASLDEDLQTYLTETRRKTESIVRFNYNDEDDMFDRHSYQKGARVIHMLRNIVGDSAFFESLHQYLVRYQYGNAEVNQLRLVFEQVTGMDLSQFFDQWYYKPGHPKLNIKYSFDSVLKQEKITVEQTQTEPSLHIYNFPLKIDIYSNGSVKTFKTIVNQRRQDFYLYCDAKPDLVNVDADKVLLCEKNDSKNIAEFMFQYHHAKNYKDQLEALEYASTLQYDNFSARELLLLALRSPNWYIRKFAADNINMDDSFSIAKIAPLMKEVMINDEKAVIRSIAVRKLGNSKFSSQFRNEFETATKDSSYTVCAEALKALINAGAPNLLSICQKMEDDENATIQGAVAKVYAEKGNIDNYSFFNKILKQKSRFALYPLINSFGTFLYRMPDPIIEKGTLILNNIAQSDPEWQVRYAAFEAIRHFKSKYNADLEKDRIAVINSILNEIKSKETNRQLLEIYSNQK